MQRSYNILYTGTLHRDLIDLSGDVLDIQAAQPVRELVIVDGAIAESDKSVLRRALRPGVAMVQINSVEAGLPQVVAALGGYKNLAAIHIVSHAQAGEILLGSSRITAETVRQEVHAFAAIHGAVRNGGDLLFYGCDLAATAAGEDLLDDLFAPFPAGQVEIDIRPRGMAILADATFAERGEHVTSGL